MAATLALEQAAAVPTLAPSFDANEDDFKKWAEFFQKNGYIVLNNAIPPEQVEKLRAELKQANYTTLSQARGKAKHKGDFEENMSRRHVMNTCFFERSKTTVDLVESSLLVDFAQHLIAHGVPGGRGNSLKAHLIHNNAFTVPAGGRGQAAVWHTDDPPQQARLHFAIILCSYSGSYFVLAGLLCLQIILPEGKKLPEWVQLPVLVVTYMIWLSDCDTPEKGPTCIVPGSHRWGRAVDDPALAEKKGVAACGKAGTAVLVNSQVWHRGCENTSTTPRETLQLTFARRIIGHKFKTIMNYQLPAHVLKNRSHKTTERFGFLEGGAYS